MIDGRDLPAGPELDRLMAIQVMKWRTKPETGMTDYYSAVAGAEAGDAEDDWLVADENWQPSSDMGHAWNVAEEVLSRLACFIHIDSPIKIGEHNPRHYVKFHSFTGVIADAVGDTVPHAICRAALSAVTR